MLESLRKLAFLVVAILPATLVLASQTHLHAKSQKSEEGFGKGFVPRNLLVLGDSYSDSCNTQRYVNNDTHKVPFPTCYVSVRC